MAIHKAVANSQAHPLQNSKKGRLAARHCVSLGFTVLVAHSRNTVVDCHVGLRSPRNDGEVEYGDFFFFFPKKSK
ncbi:MAG: hypothetical protein FWD01_00935 [Defluviitaleaceae bacterium]|nr:hypothetical protein [Defluviitaleaceae bacterium]